MDVNAAISLMLALIEQLQRVSNVIAQAKADGRTTLSPAEWSAVLAADDAARALLQPSIPTASPAEPLVPDGT